MKTKPQIKNRKIKITDAQRKQLIELRKEISDAFESYKGKSDMRVQLESKLEKLEKAIERKEKTINALDDAAVFALSYQQNQSGLIRKRLAEMDDDDSPEYRKALRSLPEILKPILALDVLRLIDEITAVFEPFYLEPGAARQAARNCGVVFRYNSALNMFWLQNPSVDQSGRALKWISAMIEGNDPTFID